MGTKKSSARKNAERKRAFLGNQCHPNSTRNAARNSVSWTAIPGKKKNIEGRIEKNGTVAIEELDQMGSDLKKETAKRGRGKGGITTNRGDRCGAAGGLAAAEAAFRKNPLQKEKLRNFSKMKKGKSTVPRKKRICWKTQFKG